MTTPTSPMTPDPADDGPATAPVPAGRARARGGVVTPVLSLLVALACAAGTLALARFAVGSARGQRLDQLILTGAQSYEGRLSAAAEIAVGSVSTPVIAGVLAATVLLVLVRRRPGLLLPLAALVIGANVSTQVIKHLLLTREALAPGIEITPNSFPSGHTALAASAAVALVLAAGPARWLVALLGAVWTAGAGIGTLVLGWHRPSDVVGAILVVAAWTFLILCLDGVHSRVRRSRLARSAGRGRRRSGTPVTGGRPRHGVLDVVTAVLLVLTGVVATGYAVVTLGSLDVPLVLGDSAQQAAGYRGMAGLICGGTALWLALVLLLRVPYVPSRARGERVP